MKIAKQPDLFLNTDTYTGAISETPSMIIAWGNGSYARNYVSEEDTILVNYRDIIAIWHVKYKIPF